MDENMSVPRGGSSTKERLCQTGLVKRQLDTSRGGGGLWVYRANALAAPQTEPILRVHAQQHRGDRYQSKYLRENQQF
jgi:hypothetical protein